MSSIPESLSGLLGPLVTFLQGFSTVQLVLLALVNIPLIAIAINVLLQLVSILSSTRSLLLTQSFCSSRETARCPRSCSTSSHGLGPQQATARILSSSSLKTGKRCACCHVYLSTTYSRCILVQYGPVFTFVLLGRRITVALNPAGNNFIMGGKHTVFSAEDAYTVSLYPSSPIPSVINDSVHST